MTKRTAFGRYLRQKRIDAGLSLRVAADRLGVSHVYLGEVERGVRGPLRREHWSAMVKAIPGITMAELEEVAKASKPIQIDLNDANPQYQDLALALARRIEQQDLSESEIKRLLSVLKRRPE